MGEAAVIESVVQTGHVVLTQSKPVGKGGAGTSESGSSEIVANGDRADYDGKSEVLQLSGSPRLRDGELDISADRVEISRLTGDATARGNVKASWLQGAKLQSSLPSGLLGGSTGANGNNPVHAVAAMAELHQATSEVIFRAAVGDHASSAGGAQPRLWQGANSIAAPVITLNRLKQTLVAESRGPANAVRSVLLNEASGHSSQKESSHPSVIRLLSADLHYSEGERLAVLHGGTAANVVAESAGADGTATIRAKVVEIHLPPAGVHSEAAGPNADRDSAAARSAGIDRMIAQGQVSVEWPGRRGTGEKLVYTGENGVYVLTGSAGQPPRVMDEAMGNVTGNTLIFHGRDDSVTVEGDGGKTVTETQSSSRSSIRPQAVGKPKKR
jgi:lipopolysaccharide export system protein LptA